MMEDISLKIFLCLQLSWPPSDNDHVTIDARVYTHA